MTVDGSYGEAIMKAALAELFPAHAFEKTRQPSWLGGLELDSYNEPLRLAFEYQGIQHYEFVPFFHNGDRARFAAQRERDQRKREAAGDAWVTLVEVPYTIPLSQVRAFVRQEVLDLGYYRQGEAPPEVPDDEFYASALTEGARSAVMLDKARRTAESHGGRCLSDLYLSCREPLAFECAKGHRFSAPLANVNRADHGRPRWCPECGGTRRRTDEENRALVAPSGYELLEVASAHIGGRTLQQFHLRCPSGHEYRALRENFLPVVVGKPKRGCMRCARARTNQQRSIEARAERAARFGLKPCGAFAPRHLPTDWECLASGHKFEASWNTILFRKGRKCLEC